MQLLVLLLLGADWKVFNPIWNDVDPGSHVKTSGCSCRSFSVLINLMVIEKEFKIGSIHPYFANFFEVLLNLGLKMN